MLPFKIPVAYLHHESQYVKFSPKAVENSFRGVLLSIGMQFICWSDTWLHRISVVARCHDCMTSWRLDDHSFKLTDRRRWFWFSRDSFEIHWNWTGQLPSNNIDKEVWLNSNKSTCSWQHRKIIQYYVTSKNQYVYLLLFPIDTTFYQRSLSLLGRFVPASQGNIDTIVANAKGISVSNFISSLGGYSVAPERWEGMGIFFYVSCFKNGFNMF